MPMDRFIIAPFGTGWQNDLRPWLIPEDAFESLLNAYVFRGVVRKRFGGDLMAPTPQGSRFRIPLTGGAGIGITDAGGNAIGTVPGTIFKVGQMFSIGTQLYTVVTAGFAAMLNTGAGATTYNTANGVYQFAGAPPLTQIFFYPAEPVMGLTNFEVGPVDNQPSYGFDTQFAYVFVTNAWARSGTGITPQWHGNNSQLFWAENWKGINVNDVLMYVTNFNATVPVPLVTDDPIWSFDGTTWVPRIAPGANGIYFLPSNLPRYTGPYVKTARLIIAFKDRLLLLNTIENDNPLGNGTVGTNSAYPQRCRYSINGSPVIQNSWYESNQMDSSGTPNNLSRAAGAGFIDATTDEQIITAEFIKDRLIVYFENSTWELVYTSNEVLPFRWQKINTELGSVATFSVVPFDKQILDIGSTGVHACNGANVERIDIKIPDQIFDFEANEVERTFGIRDYFTEAVYWTYTSDESENPFHPFPNQVLLYNYRNNTWALNEDSITAFGYFEQQADITWATVNNTWSGMGSATWASGILQAQFRQILAGNQEGYVFIVDPGRARNAPVLQITNMVITGVGTLILTIIDHNLLGGQYIAIENAQGVTNVNVDYALNIGIYSIQEITATTVTVTLKNGQVPTGTYTGGGNVTRVSNLGIVSKQWNPYVSKSRNVYLSKIDFGVETTANGQVTIDYFISSSQLPMIQEAQLTNTILGTNILETFPYPTVPFEAVQTRLWHPVYFQASGECVQIIISMNPDQITSPAIAWEEFVLEGMVLYTQPTTSRLQ